MHARRVTYSAESELPKLYFTSEPYVALTLAFPDCAAYVETVMCYFGFGCGYCGLYPKAHLAS